MNAAVIRHLGGTRSRRQREPEPDQQGFDRILGPLQIVLVGTFFGLKMRLFGPRSPRWLWWVAILGLAVWVTQVVAERRRRAQARSQEAEWGEKGELWRTDYRWDPESVTSDFAGFGVGWLRPAARWVAGGLVIVLFQSLKWSGWKWGGCYSSLVLALSLPFLLLSFLPTLSLTWLRFGDSHLYFGRHPYFLGEELVFRLRGFSDLPGLTRLRVTLRCIEEGFSGSRQSRSYSVLHEEERFLAPGGGTLEELPVAGTVRVGAGPDDRRAVRCEFLLPADAGLETHLASQTPRYWELVVVGERKGIDYRGIFLLPVYSRR